MLAAILLAGAVSATPAPMTLAQAIDFANAHNSQVLAARAQWVQAGATLARNRSSQLPQVQGLAQSSMNKQNSSGSFAQFGLSPSSTFSQNTAEVQGLQSVFNLTNELAANQARHQYDAAAQNLRFVKEQTVINVETSYYGYEQEVQLVGLAQSDYAYQHTLLDIANANFRSGRVAGIDRLRAQVQLTSSEETLASTQADAEDARQNLAQLIGADAAQPFVVSSSIVVPKALEPDQDVLNALALTHRPEVAIAKDNLDTAVLAYGLVDAPNRPTVALQAGVGNQDTPTLNAANAVSCQGNPHCTATHFYTVALTSQWLLPLIDWGTVHSAHNSAKASIEEQSAAYESARRQALIDVDQAVRRYKVDTQNLTLATQNADVAKQAAQIVQVQYKVGLASQVDVTSAEQTYLQAARQLLAAQVGYLLAADKLKLATGMLVTT